MTRHDCQPSETQALILLMEKCLGNIDVLYLISFPYILATCVVRFFQGQDISVITVVMHFGSMSQTELCRGVNLK